MNKIVILQKQREGGEYLPARAVWERYGVSHMTIHRWLNDAKMRFPRPVKFGRLRFWRQSDLEAWEQQQGEIA